MGIAKRHVQIGGISSVEHLPGDFFEGQTVWFFESSFNEWDCRKGTIIKVYKKVADVDFGSDEQRVSLQRLFTEYPFDKVEVWLLNTTLLFGLEATCSQVVEACRFTAWPIRRVEEDAMEGGAIKTRFTSGIPPTCE
jgi:hypothetical protein